MEPPFFALERMFLAVEPMFIDFITVELRPQKSTKVGIAFDFWQSGFAWYEKKTIIGVIT